MSQSNFRVPKFCFHKSTGQAYLAICGKRGYLGRFETAEAQAAYEEVAEDLRRQSDTLEKWTTSISR